MLEQASQPIHWENLDQEPIVYLRGGLWLKGGFATTISKIDKDDDSFFNLKINVKSLVSLIEQRMTEKGIPIR